MLPEPCKEAIIHMAIHHDYYLVYQRVWWLDLDLDQLGVCFLDLDQVFLLLDLDQGVCYLVEGICCLDLDQGPGGCCLVEGVCCLDLDQGLGSCCLVEGVCCLDQGV